MAGHGRALDLGAELASVRSVLVTAGIAVHVGPDPLPDPAAVPATAGTVLATVLREAVTNVLRHSDARCCRIRLRVEEREVGVEVVNDGVRTADLGRPDPAGSGLGSLAARARGLGGCFDAGPAPDGHFTVRVSLPAAC